MAQNLDDLPPAMAARPQAVAAAHHQPPGPHSGASCQDVPLAMPTQQPSGARSAGGHDIMEVFEALLRRNGLGLEDVSGTTSKEVKELCADLGFNLLESLKVLKAMQAVPPSAEEHAYAWRPGLHGYQGYQDPGCAEPRCPRGYQDSAPTVRIPFDGF